jgi:hypothetical protein
MSENASIDTDALFTPVRIGSLINARSMSISQLPFKR